MRWSPLQVLCSPCSSPLWPPYSGSSLCINGCRASPTFVFKPHPHLQWPITLLSPKDCLLWERNAPRASYWLGVSNTHPFIHGGQPMGATLPPPYSPAPPPTPLTPALQPYHRNNHPIPGIPGVVYPGVTIPLPPTNPVPIYDVHCTDMGPPNICGNTYILIKLMGTF